MEFTDEFLKRFVEQDCYFVRIQRSVLEDCPDCLRLFRKHMLECGGELGVKSCTCCGVYQGHFIDCNVDKSSTFKTKKPKKPRFLLYKKEVTEDLSKCSVNGNG
jgi:hypothetical protein